ncbi:MAG: 5-formyltetrahydrofolate cyclo-ligase [Hyphomonadaceae bacterium]|nr:5-formyltetrahydrofolate cyclo-ligase [Hyphomonadaceae bacterium]
MTDKAGLRAEMKELRAELSARNPDAGEHVAEKFPMRLLERYGPEVAGYLAIGSEIDALPLMKHLEKAGAELSLPRIEEDGSMTYRRWSPGEPLERRPFGLSEPCSSAPEVWPTLILTPLLAFDQMGNRLGYGQGHYDRTLSRLREAGRAFACALAYHGQLVDEVPVESHDQPLDWAVTEEGSFPLFMMRNMRAISAASGGV